MNNILRKIPLFSLFLVLFVGTAFNSNQNLNASNDFDVNYENIEVYNNVYMDGRIYFDSPANGNWDIFSMNGQGGDIKQLTFSSADERWPTVSPNGDHIAYSSNEDGNYNIVIQDVQGGDRRFNLTHNGSDEFMPDWGPWDQVLFVSNVNGNKDIFLKNVWGTPEERQSGQSQAVQMTFSDKDETEPAFGGESFGNVFAYEMDGNIWGMDTDSFMTWPIIEDGSDNISPVFHPYDSLYRDQDMQPQFMYLKNDQLRWSNFGWNNNYSGGNIKIQVPGTLNRVSISKDDPCTVAFVLNDGGKIGLANHCNPSSNSILLPNGNTNFMADKIVYARGNAGGMSGMMGGMMDMGNKMMNDMQRQDEMMREEMERQAEIDRERNEMMMKQMEEQERMDRERMEQQMEMEEERMRMEKERMDQQMESDRQRMEMEREMMEEQDRLDRERMEQQRDMMNRMEGDGGRNDFMDEECMVESAEEGRGLFGNAQIGDIIDCEGGDGLRERFEDPTSLAMLGLVVTVGATLLQMLRGN